MTQAVNLSLKDAKSDKVYNASLEESNGGFVVNFSYGKRGSALSTGTKTSVPLDLIKAKKIYDSLVNEKLAKGYKGPLDGTISITHVEKTDTGMLAQLLNPVKNDDDLGVYLYHNRYYAQEKQDGRRIMVRKSGSREPIIGANRKGQQVAIDEDVEADLLQIQGDFEIDGEMVGNYYRVFDIMSKGGVDLRQEPYNERLAVLYAMFEVGGDPDLTFWNTRVVETAYTTGEKLELLDRLKLAKREGIVFKDQFAPYTVGRPNSGGPQMKYKFYDTASFVVAQINDQRSVGLSLRSAGALFVEAGNVTIPPNYDVPNVGDVVEVRYLYAFKDTGRVYQPSYLGRRDDIDQNDCVVTQLKYKSEEGE